MTYAEFTASLAGLKVTGVNRRFSNPPQQLQTAHLPAQWPRLPSGDTSIVTMTGGADLPAITCDLAIVVEAIGQNTQPANWTKAIGVIDGLHTALAAEAENGVIDRWTLRLQGEYVGETAYWMIVATVTGSE